MLILTFACTAERPRRLVDSDEHVDVGEFELDELRGSRSLPAGYLRSIRSVA